MKKIFYFIIFFSLLIVYIYSIVFDFFPISTKIILEGVGLLFCIKYLASKNYRIKNEYKTILKYLCLLMLWDVITSIVNGHSEFHIIKEMLPVIGSFFGAEFIYRYYKRNFTDDKQFYKIIVIVIFAESMLAVLMKAFPALYSIIDSFLVFDFGSDEIINIFDLSRFFGIGNAHYFGVSASCSLGVMTSVFVLANSNNVIERISVIIMWIAISLISFMTARWALLSVGISVMFFLYCLKGQSIIKTISIAISLVIVVYIAYFVTMNNADDQLQKWAFSFFVDRSQDDHSADNVRDWWLNTSVDYGTLFIGDAQYTDPQGGYYKHIDIGLYRQIFYGGLPFLLLNLFTHWKILKMNLKYNSSRYYKGLLFSLIIGYIGILAKGDANMMTFFILYLVFSTGGVFEVRRYNY